MFERRYRVDQQQTNLVRFAEFGPSSLNIWLRAYTYSLSFASFYKLREAVYFDIMDIINQHGAAIAFPTQTLHLAHEKTTPASQKKPKKPSKTSENTDVKKDIEP